MANGVRLRHGNRKNKYPMHPGLPVLGPVISKARLKAPTRSTNMSPGYAKSDSLSAQPAKRTNVAQTSRWKIDSMTSPSLMHNSRRPVAPIPPHTRPPGGRHAGCCSLGDNGGVLPSSLRTSRGRGPRCFQRRAPVHHDFMRRPSPDRPPGAQPHSRAPRDTSAATLIFPRQKCSSEEGVTDALGDS